MHFTVQVVRGARPGASREFRELDAGGATFGRGGEVDFAFSPDDVTVSRGVHFRVIAEDAAGGLRIRNEHRNPLFLSERGGGARQPVAQGEERTVRDETTIQVGEGGPVLVLSLPSLAPATQSRIQAAGVTTRVAAIEESVVESVRTSRRWLPVAFVSIAALAAGGWALSERFGERSDRIEVQVSLLGDALGSSRDQIAALSVRLKSLDSREEAGSAGMSALASRMEGLEIEAAAGTSEERLSAALAAARESVYVAAVRGPTGRLSGIGTAWKVGARSVATNAHVGIALLESVGLALPEGGRGAVPLGEGPQPLEVVLLRPAADPAARVVLAVASIEIHPGFLRYGSDYPDPAFRFNGLGGIEQLDWLGVCDTGVLTTREEIPGASLRLAGPERLARLRGGDPVGAIGFPGLSRGSGDENPDPVISIGHVQATMDPFGETSAAEESCILVLDLATAPGSSGSPVIDTDGQVVGLVHATRATQAHSFHFGQRVDLLAELLDGRVDEHYRARRDEWRGRWSRWASPDALAAVLIGRGRMWVEEKARERASETTGALAEEPPTVAELPIARGELRVSPDAPVTIALPDEAREPGFYAAIAISADASNIDLRVTTGEETYADAAPDGYPTLLLAHRGGELPTIEVLGGPAAGVAVTYFIVRYELAP